MVLWELQLSAKVSLVVAEDAFFPLWLEMKREQEDDNGNSEVWGCVYLHVYTTPTSSSPNHKNNAE